MIDLGADWETVKPDDGTREKMPAGGYACTIVNADIYTSKKGNLMLRLALDVCAGDYANFFRRQWERKKSFDTNAGWPCIFYQALLAESRGRLKHVINCIEHDNPGFKFKGDEKTLIKKTIGVIFREEEFLSNGNLRSNVKPYQVVTLEKAQTAEPPEPKRLREDDFYQNTPANSPNPPSIDDEEVPF